MRFRSPTIAQGHLGSANAIIESGTEMSSRRASPVDRGGLLYGRSGIVHICLPLNHSFGAQMSKAFVISACGTVDERMIEMLACGPEVKNSCAIRTAAAVALSSIR